MYRLAKGKQAIRALLRVSGREARNVRGKLEKPP